MAFFSKDAPDAEIGHNLDMQICIIGAGYVGAALAVALSFAHEVRVHDIDHSKAKRLEEWNKAHGGRACFVADQAKALEGAEYVFLAVPTDFDETTHRFDVSIVESVVDEVVRLSPSAAIVIKSTVPVGFTRALQQRYPDTTILFSPEFLREANAVEDCLNPSRVVIGCDPVHKAKAEALGDLFRAASADAPVLIAGLDEAEAIKLFANTYLALRVAYFNELDTYALYHGLSAKEIIDGVCLDPRIGQGYNNPSFGYGGYCLPKDTKQLLHNFEFVPQNLIDSVVKSNLTRKKAIADEAARLAKKKSDDPRIGVYRLAMKAGSDNFRQSAIIDILDDLAERGFKVLVYEPNLQETSFHGASVIHDLDRFKEESTLILTNRMDDNLSDVKEKTFTRDLFHRD